MLQNVGRDLSRPSSSAPDGSKRSAFHGVDGGGLRIVQMKEEEEEAKEEDEEENLPAVPQ